MGATALSIVCSSLVEGMHFGVSGFFSYRYFIFFFSYRYFIFFSYSYRCFIFSFSYRYFIFSFSYRYFNFFLLTGGGHRPQTRN